LVYTRTAEYARHNSTADDHKREWKSGTLVKVVGGSLLRSLLH
jgi:hypothetical protein